MGCLLSLLISAVCGGIFGGVIAWLLSYFGMGDFSRIGFIVGFIIGFVYLLAFTSSSGMSTRIGKDTWIHHKWDD